jgi:hypothetical protein
MIFSTISQVYLKKLLVKYFFGLEKLVDDLNFTKLY